MSKFKDPQPLLKLSCPMNCVAHCLTTETVGKSHHSTFLKLIPLFESKDNRAALDMISCSDLKPLVVYISWFLNGLPSPALPSNNGPS